MYAETLGELIDQLEDIRRKTDSAVSVRIMNVPYGITFKYYESNDCVVLEGAGPPVSEEAEHG